MPQITHYVGLDVHKKTIAMAIARPGRERAVPAGEFPAQFSEVLRRLKPLGAPGELACCYEAGPAGFVLARQLQSKGYPCDVVAPSKIPRRASRRIKTDGRDALDLAEYLRSGHLVPVTVPDEECESMRDLVRAREDARRACSRSRQQLLHFLLRRDRKYLAGKHWTKRHREWLQAVSFDLPAHQLTMDSYLAAIAQQEQRQSLLEAQIELLYPTTQLGPLVKALQSMRGVKTIVAATVAFELGCFKRFATAGHAMSYIGIVPSESSSGERRRQGSITRTGNGYVRRVLVEAAWSYRFRPALNKELKKRQEEVAPRVQQIAWKAQTRLNHRYRRMQLKAKSHQLVVTAIARELMGFMWAIGQEDPLLA